jgi:hypothetical protein
MKSLAILVISLFTLLTVVEPAGAEPGDAATLRVHSESEGPERLSDLPMRLNPQIGVSSFEYSGRGGSKAQLSGGATVEFGRPSRKLETGVILMRTGAEARFKGENDPTLVTSTYLTLPMMAKLRLVSMRAQSWYFKAGAMPAFEVGGNRDAATNNLDVLASIGLSGRLAFTRKADFVIEASYNRGLIDALHTAGDNYNQGVLVLAGLSFRI